MMRAGLSLAVVGAGHPNKRGPDRRFEIAICRPGEPIELVPEPKNPADERAVAVFSCRGVQLGYLTAERCGWVKGQIERGADVRAIFQQATTYGAVIRATFDGSDPVLPPALPTTDRVEDDEPVFYPDPEWDE